MDSFIPQENVLSLFDPLVRPETPPRNTSSPEPASDKENDVQPGPVTVFFSRIYKDIPVQKISKNPKGKLIDFGERTPVPPRQEDMLGDEGFDCFAEDEEEVPDSPGVSRRPLADIDLEQIPQTLRRPSIIPEDLEDVQSVYDPVSSAPAGTPFTDVVNSINLSAMTLTDFQDPPVASSAFICPNIAVCSPEPAVIAESTPARLESRADTSCGSSFVLLSPTAHTSTSTDLPPCGTRRTQTSNLTSSADPRRISVDLQSTFSLHMQSADMSFDLINDKISFLNASNSSWTIVDADRDDDTFELTKQRLHISGTGARHMEMPDANLDEDTLDLAKEQKRIEVLQKCEPIREESLDEIVVVVPRVKELTPPKPTPSIGHTLESAAKAPARPPVFSLPPATSTKVEPRSEHKPAELTKPLPTPHLTKKTWTTQHERVSSSTSTTSTLSSSAGSSTIASSRRSSISSSLPTLSSSSVFDVSRSASTTVAKTPARRLSSVSTTSSITGAPKAAARGFQRPLPAPLPALSAFARPNGAARAPSPTKPGPVPKSAPVSEPLAPPRPSAGVKPTFTASVNRLQRPAPTGLTAWRGSVRATVKPVVPGLRHPVPSLASTGPSAVVANSGLGAIKSGLPRPASRLPAPTKSTFGGARRL
ncbi:uncharacterized protein PHACADRAFT_27086 [Phanerochaete carnosa HHB-10118-sp]|uniref:Uncharacterized protein n=1 Tax=Phanerochaete carnosa (strain HHB-10118-sp) TaxID=650164 RepID=K5X6X1_PHACS|nr:uncharacterized protein PHACADRAFT_27086 [Phanerochaete carnosa HHB-10118-sp]EKM58632.1 hypothetical protein PHACADRAFT_27086 [Phanerochaete carnosa HHB-10118-sp]